MGNAKIHHRSLPNLIYVRLLSTGVSAVINIARLNMGVSLSKFSLFIGLIALALGGAGIIGYSYL